MCIHESESINMDVKTYEVGSLRVWMYMYIYECMYMYECIHDYGYVYIRINTQKFMHIYIYTYNISIMWVAIAAMGWMQVVGSLN